MTDLPGAVTEGDLCPECDHDTEEHDPRGCREWTPTWPRLVRCACKLPYGQHHTRRHA